MLLPAILARRSVRAFKDAAVSDALITELITAAQLSPTSRGNKAVECLVVRDADKKNKLFALLEQDFVLSAPALLVLTTRTDATSNPVQDLSIASQSIFLQAASLGLGTVWKNVRTEQVDTVRNILGIPEGYIIINLIPVGFPTTPPTAHAAAETDSSRIHWDRW